MYRVTIATLLTAATAVLPPGTAAAAPVVSVGPPSGSGGTATAVVTLFVPAGETYDLAGFQLDLVGPAGVQFTTAVPTAAPPYVFPLADSFAVQVLGGDLIAAVGQSAVTLNDIHVVPQGFVTLSGGATGATFGLAAVGVTYPGQDPPPLEVSSSQLFGASGDPLGGGGSGAVPEPCSGAVALALAAAALARRRPRTPAAADAAAG